jgi:hypothetical protein
VRFLALLFLLSLCACEPPESTRTRGGGSGADPGNHAENLRVRERTDMDRNVPARTSPR